MANLNAIAAVCEAIRHILETAAEADRAELGFANLDLNFAVFGAEHFAEHPIAIGVSVFLYRVVPNLSHRTPAGALRPDGRRLRPRLPLDLHLLLTAWGDEPATHNRMVGWMMRTLEDYPILPASVLNHGVADTFEPEEAVELVLSEMPGEELLHLWELLSNGEVRYRTTVPYIARAVRIDSHRLQPGAEAVQVRQLDLGRLEATPANGPDHRPDRGRP